MNGQSIYTYLDSKKIYFISKRGKYMLIEKNNTKKVLSLVSRNTVVIDKNNGILLFPNDK